MSELDGPVITDPAMYSDDREARTRRAEYVHAAVDGRNATSGEETTIPIPRSDDGIEELLDRLEADREEVERTDIEDLEAEIDPISPERHVTQVGAHRDFGDLPRLHSPASDGRADRLIDISILPCVYAVYRVPTGTTESLTPGPLGTRRSNPSP